LTKYTGEQRANFGYPTGEEPWQAPGAIRGPMPRGCRARRGG
jgi:hypothetical protein